MNRILEGINSRIIDAKEQISDLEDTRVEITAIEQNIEKRMEKKNEDNLGNFWDKIKCTNICIIRVPEEEKEKKTTEDI